MLRVQKEEAGWLLVDEDKILGVYLTFLEAYEALDRYKTLEDNK